MRTARKKMINEACYYHCCARIAGPKNYYLFDDNNKKYGMDIVVDMCKLFYVEPISMTWMDNHWHAVLYVPSKAPSLEQVAKRYNGYYGKKKPPLDPEINPEKCHKVASQLVDVSDFMRRVHQKFTHHINKAHDRRGTLWAERFKSTILEDQTALWSCVKYVELNPVRAKMVIDPADYRFSTWGSYSESGKHLFKDNFARHMRNYLGEYAKDWTDEDVFAEFRSELARITADEAGVTGDDLKKIADEARKPDSMPIKFLIRTRHWTDGSIIGSKEFVQNVASKFEDNERVAKKRFSKGTNESGTILHCLKRLRLL